MKRLLFFMHTSSPIGGVETWLDRACEYLSTRGFDTTVGLVRGQKYNSPDRYRAYHPELQTVDVDGRGLNREGRVRALARCIARTKPDIVLPLGIIDANEAVIRQKLQGKTVRLLGRAQGNLEPMLADLRTYRDWMDKVICPGRLTQKVLVEWAGYRPERVLNISNGADAPTTEQVPRIPGQPLRIGYVGRLSQPDKRAMDLIALCHELRSLGVEFSLDVVGDGPCGPELRTGLAEMGPDIRLHGAMAHSDIYERIFPNLDVLILTSSSEAFGIVLVEAMMHGVVPVSSRYDGFYAEGLVVDGQTGLSFDVGAMADAAAAVTRLSGNPESLRALSVNARARALGYTWHRSLSRWEAALTELAEQEPVHGGSIPVNVDNKAPGRLDRMGIPAGVTDGLRRLRRATFGPVAQPGGEEWPLFCRAHAPSHLEEVQRALRYLDVPS